MFMDRRVRSFARKNIRLPCGVLACQTPGAPFGHGSDSQPEGHLGAAARSLSGAAYRLIVAQPEGPRLLFKTQRPKAARIPCRL